MERQKKEKPAIKGKTNHKEKNRKSSPTPSITPVDTVST